MGICSSEQKSKKDQSEWSSIRVVNLCMDSPLDSSVKASPFDQITVQKGAKYIAFEKESDDQKYERMYREHVLYIQKIYREEYKKQNYLN